MDAKHHNDEPISRGRDGAPAPQPAELCALREKLQRFEVVKCRMQHEKIQRAPDGLSPLLNAAVDHGFQRATYCDAKVRSSRLACAHTMARYELADLLDEIPDATCSRGQVTRWKEELGQLDLAIIQVDQRKSDAELDHAKQSSKVCAGGDSTPAAKAELDRITSAIQDLDDEHCTYVDRLSALLAEILASLA